MKILIVGASGFIGRHLVPHLEARGHEVESWARNGSRGLPVDLLDPEQPLPEGKWDTVFHLAGHSRPGMDWSKDWVTENLQMTARLVRHLTEQSPGCRFIFLSSGHVYAPGPQPHAESDPVSPAGPYGLSKQLCEAWVQSRTKDLRVIIVRAFNQIGPGLPGGLLVTDLLERIRSGENPLRMKGRNARRDFLDIRDAVDAYERLAGLDAPSGSVFNLCSGQAVRVSDLIGAILGGLDLQRHVVFEDPAEDILAGRNDRIHEATGWVPRHPLEATVRFILEAEHA